MASVSILHIYEYTFPNSTEEGEIFLSERPSPDGGEAPLLEPTLTEDEAEPWDTWDPAPAEVRI